MTALLSMATGHADGSIPNTLAWLVVAGVNMVPDFRPGDRVVYRSDMTHFVGNGLYVMQNGPRLAVFRASSASSGILLSQNRLAADQTVSLAQFERDCRGPIVAAFKVHDPILLNGGNTSERPGAEYARDFHAAAERMERREARELERAR